MVSVRFHDVFVGRHPGYAGHATAYVDKYDDPRATFAFWHFYEDGEYFFYADLLFCDDIQTIVVLDYYAFMHHSVAPSEEYVPHIHIPRQAAMKACMLHSIGIVLAKIYPGYKTIPYNKGHFLALQKDIQRQFRHQTNTLAKVLPWDIVDDIYDRMEPAWTRHFRVYWPKRWNTHKAVWENRTDYKRVFYNDWDTLRDILRDTVRENRVYLGKLARVAV